MDLETTLGIDGKAAAALTELDDTERALTDGGVAALARVPELTKGGAAVIARGMIRRNHDNPGGFLTTDRASEIYRDALGLLRTRTVMAYAERRLETLFPAGSAPRIEEVRVFTTDATSLDPDPDVPAALLGVKPLADPTPRRVHERCIATADAERYAAARKAFPKLSIEVVKDGRDTAELVRSYSTVVALDESFAGIDVDGDMHVLPGAAERADEVVPERLLAFFATNCETLEVAAAIHGVAKLDPPRDLATLYDVLSQLADDGTVLGGDKLKRLSNAVDNLDTAVSTAESVANDRPHDVIRERDVAIRRTDLLSLVEQGARVDSLLSRELRDEFDKALSAACDHLVESLLLRPGEVDLTERVFSDDPSLPFGHDKKAVGRLRTGLKTARDRHAAKLRAGLAAGLGDPHDPVETLVRDALELDMHLAVSRFTRDFDCVFPEFTDAAGDDGIGSFAIEAGRSSLLGMDFSDVDPVGYEVSGVTFLSGVNNGGKASALDLMELVVVLAYIGLPAPAESVRLSRLSELHYYIRSQGVLDIGAFENALRDFTALIDGMTDRLVLVDELESITEPGASTKIIAGILEELVEQGAAAVFVSHLASGTREAADVSVVVDGIEAVGLEGGELVVNRSPMEDHLTHSTPELIVEKLADENEASFYGRLLEEFN